MKLLPSEVGATTKQERSALISARTCTCHWSGWNSHTGNETGVASFCMVVAAVLIEYSSANNSFDARVSCERVNRGDW